jgi:hypothetical protein
MAKYKSMEGTVSRVVRDGRAFEIDGEWYSVFKVAQAKGVEPGDYLKFEYESVVKGDQTFHNIKGDAEITKGAPAKRSSGGSSAKDGEEVVRGPTARDIMIVRQNALSHAHALVVALGVKDLEDATDDTIAVARKLEEYILETE